MQEGSYEVSVVGFSACKVRAVGRRRLALGLLQVQLLGIGTGEGLKSRGTRGKMASETFDKQNLPSHKNGDLVTKATWPQKSSQ